MSDLLYTVVINDEVFECVDYSRPVWMKPSMKGLRFIPNNRDEVQDALIIFGVDYLDFSQDLKSKIIKMKADCIKARFLLVNHVGLPEDIDLGCKVQACLAECKC